MNRFLHFILGLVMLGGGMVRAQDTLPADTAAADSLAQADTLTSTDTLTSGDSAASSRTAVAQLGPDAMPQESEDSPPFQDSALATPYHTIWTHFYYTRRKHTDLQKAARALFPLKGLSQSQLERRAMMLQRFREGQGIYIFSEDLPRNPNHVDTACGCHRFLLSKDYPKLSIKKYGDRWLYSREAVEAVPELYHSIYPFGLDRVLNHLPESFYSDVLGVEIWQVLFVAFLVLLAFFVHRLLTVFFRFLVDRLLKYVYHEHFERSWLTPVVKPLSIYIVTQVVALFLPALQMNPVLSKYVQLGLKIILPLLLIIVAFRLIGLLAKISARLAEKTESTLDDQLIPLLKKVLQLVVILVGTVYILNELNYNVTALLAGLSIGGLAFAFAAQDTLKNFFGSILIFLDRPFQVGDYIKYGSITGTVEQVDMRSTRIRTFENSLVYVPNGQLADSSIDNFGLRHYRRYYSPLSLQYDSPPELIEAYIDGLWAMLRSHPATAPILDLHYVNLNAFNDSSVDIMFYVFFDVDDWRQELLAREDMILGAMRLAQRLNLQFAFPTQTVHVENFPGQESLSTTYTQTKQSAGEEISQFTAAERARWEARWRDIQAQWQAAAEAAEAEKNEDDD